MSFVIILVQQICPEAVSQSVAAIFSRRTAQNILDGDKINNPAIFCAARSLSINQRINPELIYYHYEMSNQHYAAFIKLTKQDVVEVSKTRVNLIKQLKMTSVQKNAQAPGRVLPHRQGCLDRYPRLDWQAEAEETWQQGHSHLQTTQVSSVSLH